MWHVKLTMALVAGAMAATALAADDAQPQVPTMTVTGDAEVMADPDRAQIRLGATAQADTAAKAQQQVSKVVTDAIAALTELGIEKKDLQTARVQLSPVYANRRPREDDGEPRIVGYRASNLVSVRVKDLSKIGDVIDAGVKAGANEVQSLSFELSDDTAARQEALGKAVEAARAKAEAMAAALKVRLAAIHRVREDQVNVRPVDWAYAGVAMERAATPVQPGQITVRASVTIEYRLEGTDLPEPKAKR